MLGDQLIKNETIALTELVKNAYDADASECRVNFVGFDAEKLTNSKGASIVIEDNGTGMTYEVITKHFLNPATPIKKTKMGEQPLKTAKGRVPQGEKGIGRFSMLKLGRKVTVLSRERDSDVVHKVVFDFSEYNDEFLNDGALYDDQEIFLDEIIVNYESVPIDNLSKELFVKMGNGTTIVIEDLKGQWDTIKIKDFEKGLLRFNPFELDNDEVVKNSDFSIDTYINDKKHDYQSGELKQIQDIVFHKALYRINGRYDENNKKFLFDYSEAGGVLQRVVIHLTPGIAEQLQAHSSEERATKDFQGLQIFRIDPAKKRQHIADFFVDGGTTECGDFEFNFYIFDFNAKPKDPLGLQKMEKDLIREHRVFLYRDEVRVQPYGAPDDDWLQVDRHRAEIRANEQFSNDQLFGQIKITKTGNERLKDKTSREGIIEDSQAFAQLILLVRGLLSYVRTKLYQNYVHRIARQKEKSLITENFIKDEFEQVKKELAGNGIALHKLDDIQQAVQKRETVYSQRIDIAEQLAGIGLSVEIASHDVMLLIDRLKDNIHQTYIDTQPNLLRNDTAWADIHKKTEEAEGMIGLVYLKMKDIQQLFVSSKQRPKLVEVKTIIKKIQLIYAKAFADNGIQILYEKIGSPVKAKIIDAVLYQVFINLFDNALYWVQEISKNRIVKITLDGFNQRVIFSDNGVGVKSDDIPYIFDAFYTGKGEEGRGLGLYIARKLLEKNGYEIDIITSDSEKELPGANFAVTFVKEEVY
jgi:signal transduction histidine kinase